MEVRFICVQPIRINIEVYEYLISNHEKYSRYFDNDSNTFNANWLNDYKKRNRWFENFKSIKHEEAIANSCLMQDLKQSSLSGLSEFLITDPTKTFYDLVFDTRLFQLVAVFNIRFDIDEKDFQRILQYSNSPSLKGNFYNSVRNLIVREDAEDKIGTWASGVFKQASSFLTDMASNGLPKKQRTILTNVCEAMPNTGNITVHVNQKPIEFFDRQGLFECNENAERKRGNRTNILDSDDISYSFFGRFHTILADDQSDIVSNRLFPIHFFIQYIWYYEIYFYDVMDKLNTNILDKKEKSGFLFYKALADSYINKVELLGITMTNFKASSEDDGEKIYTLLQKKWTLEENYDRLSKYSSFFKGFLERGYENLHEKSARRQGNILFVISCVQILGIVSIWKDFLGLEHLVPFLNVSNRLIDLKPILLFNFSLPILLILIVSLLFYYGYRAKK